jgi:hypothetical protein
MRLPDALKEMCIVHLVVRICLTANAVYRRHAVPGSDRTLARPNAHPSPRILAGGPHRVSRLPLSSAPTRTSPRTGTRVVFPNDIFAKPQPFLDAQQPARCCSRSPCGRGPVALSPATAPSWAPRVLRCARAASGEVATTSAAIVSELPCSLLSRFRISPYALQNKRRRLGWQAS